MVTQKRWSTRGVAIRKVCHLGSLLWPEKFVGEKNLLSPRKSIIAQESSPTKKVDTEKIYYPRKAHCHPRKFIDQESQHQEKFITQGNFTLQKSLSSEESLLSKKIYHPEKFIIQEKLSLREVHKENFIIWNFYCLENLVV